MAKRPYFRSSIAQLETLFEASKSNRAVLDELLEELHHRDRPRATALAKKVAEELAALAGMSASRPSTVSQSGGTTRNGSQSNRAAPTTLLNANTHANDAPKSSVAGGGNSADSKSAVEQVPTFAKGSLGRASPIDFGEARPWFAPDVQLSATPDPVLAAWLTLEVLTLQPLPESTDLEATSRTLVQLAECPEPWGERRFWRRGKEKAVYWMVYLGELDLSKATEAILRIYPDNAIDERPDVKGNTTLAVIVTDAHGKPVEGKTFLSSFAWGYGQVRGGRLKGLAGFPAAEQHVKAELERRIIRQDENSEIIPLTHADILAAIGWLTKVLNLPDDEVIRPGLAVRVPQWNAYGETPEPELLNSFFIEDLVRVRNAFSGGNVGPALSAYMGAAPTKARCDVIRDAKTLAETLAPNRFPATRWPGPGRHPLVLMQQAAINHAVAELANGGLVAVNGPPGTGKTTLLRDVVANVVLNRAIAMAKFDKPVDAFAHLGSMRTGQAYTHLYQLDDSLLGHEIVVASSNNKAVENISREIPSARAVADDLDPPPRYFQSVADTVAAGSGVIEDGTTWGLAAAVLGNSANRSAFIQSFYWHKKRGIARYLKAIVDAGLQEDDDDTANAEDIQQILDVVTIEKPPRSEIEALERWRNVRRRFLAQLKTAQEHQKKAQSVYDAVRQRPQAKRRSEAADDALRQAETIHAAAAEKEQTATRLQANAEAEERKAGEERSVTDRLRPGFFARLFGTQRYRAWRAQMAAAQETLRAARAKLQSATKAFEDATKEAAAANGRVKEAAVEARKAQMELNRILATIDAMCGELGGNLADESFWSQEDEVRQLKSPWINDEWQRARDQLFVDAFALHRAFIDAAAKPFRHNLRAALDVMKGRVLKPEQESARRSLWASLFMIVPVISTTFASTARLFGSLGREQLGWVLIDEAGQAVPQAAVGALWRAKKAIVIGDPLQIQPVVTIPPKLIRAIFAEFGVNTEEWAGPEMSAQTLADRMSWFGTNILTADGDIWLGSPLRVHRRCENPMFRISNHVAYDGTMVYGTSPAKSPVGEILGDSAWLHVDDAATGKWSETEGRVAVDLLRTLVDSGMTDPDVFFISPFRIVAQKLRELIRSDRSITQRLAVPAREWIWDRVGTVHTFQGKEAEAVVFVLGASTDASAGARRWAGHPPNLVNVAITRAKRRIYVIGNHNAWKDAGAFAHLAQLLPVTCSGNQ